MLPPCTPFNGAYQIIYFHDLANAIPNASTGVIVNVNVITFVVSRFNALVIGTIPTWCSSAVTSDALYLASIPSVSRERIYETR